MLDKISLSKILKLWAPHVVLLIISLVYSLVAAAIFVFIEWPHVILSQQENELEVKKNQNSLIKDLLAMKGNSSNFDDFAEKSNERIEQFYKGIYAVHKNSKGLTDSGELQKLSYASALFSVVSTLVTIGYGNVVPVTRVGRAFCIGSCLIGIPLLLITTADIAKFLSSAVNALYVKYLEWKSKLLEKYCGRYLKSKRPSIVELEDPEAMAEYVWQNAEEIHYVQLPALWLLLVVVGYACLGSLMFGYYENWTFFHGFYFCIISVLKVGFGDVLPSSIGYVAISLAYIFLGIIIATMCVDVVGIEYVRKIHLLGRVAQVRVNVDYLNLIRKAKYQRKQREAMRSMIGMLSAVDKMPIEANASAYPGESDFKMPTKPDIPKNLRTIDTTPYSIKIVWEPYDDDFGRKWPVTYTLTYCMKHARRPVEHTIKEISGNEYNITGLTSFSIYEITLTATNELGTSDPARIVQSTEPETAPHSLKAELLDDKTVKLTWKPPFKGSLNLMKYAIYYNENAEEAFDKWSKLIVDSNQLEASIENLNNAEKYAFCISSVDSHSHSPISSCVYAKKRGDK